jgi:hypothetical protein
MSLTPLAYKMNEKTKEKGFQSLSRSMPCWHINEKKHWPTNVNIQRPLWLEGETSLLGIDCDKTHI